jgi:hypothetical protein
MKKRDKKLEFHRDTLRRLDPSEAGRADLLQVAGGGPQTSESQPCCGSEVDTIAADALPTIHPIKGGC